MLKVCVSFILLLLFSSNAFSQTLTDVALNQGVSVFQQSAGHDGNGMTFYDFDNDGWDDLTFPTQFDSISFYRNNNGIYENTGSYLYAPGSIRQIIWVDLSNDGIFDLCVSYADLGVRLYENDGNFNFTDITSGSGISMTTPESYGVSFADPDSDGDLDLYVCYYNYSVSNKFYVNQGNGTFVEMASIYGLDNDLNPSFMGSWFDYNNDNLIDLHVINDKEIPLDAMFKNNGNNSFDDVAFTEGLLNNDANPMTTSISDFNNDGYQDIFVSDISSGTPAGVAFDDYKLFMSQGGGNFVNVAPQLGIDTSLFAWGALWVDYDNDCFEDLYIATSRINAIANPDETSLFYKNNSGASFTKINDSIIGDIVNSAYCPVKGDINNDGFYDIVVLNDSEDPSILLNSANNGNGYIKITPVGIMSNKQAIGAKIKVHAAGQSQLQTVFCGTALCAQYSQHMIFGVKDAASVDSIEVIFPSGIVVKEYNLPINQSYTVLEQVFEQVDLGAGQDTLYLCQGDSVVLGVDGYHNYAWNTGSTDSLIVISSPGVFQFQASTLILDTIIESSELTVLWENFPSVQQLVVQPACGTEDLGSINIILNNSNDSISSILWSNGNQEFLLDSLSEGVYNYEITTPNNCSVLGSVTLIETPPFTIQYISSPVTDFQQGSVQFFEFGGIPDFTYTMNGMEQDSFIDSLDAGNYEVMIEDANGCIVTVQFTINDESSASLSEVSETIGNVFYNNQSIVICINDDIEVQLYDMKGTKVELQGGLMEQPDGCQSLQCNLESGLYQIRIQSEQNSFSKTVFVH